MLTAVTFDFWGTLAQDSPETLALQQALRIQAIRRTLDRVGVALGEAETVAAYDRSGALLWERFWSRHRDPGLREQVRLVLDCCAPGIAARIGEALLAETVEAYAAPTLIHPPALVPGAAHAVRALSAHGITLAVISNTGRTPGAVLRKLLERHDLARHFATTTFSDEVGCRKPDSEIFRLTLERAGAPPGAAAHVGDNPVDDVAGARGAGMLAVHYTGGDRPGSDQAHIAVGDLTELADRLFRVAP